MSNYFKIIDHVSRSGLVQLSRSPAHYKHYIENEITPTPAMIFGSALHTYVLENKDFEDRYAVLNNKYDLRTKVGKEGFAEFKASAGDKQVIGGADFDKIKAMSTAINNDAAGKLLLENGEFEKELYWTDEDTGVKCKAKPDIITGHAVGDLKTVADGSFRAVKASIFKYGYHIQAAMIRAALKANNLQEMHSFWLICVEKDAPYVVTSYKLGDDLIDLGYKEFKRLLVVYKECLSTNVWGNPEPSVINL